MFELIRSNKRRSLALVAGFMVVVALVGAAIGFVVGNGILVYASSLLCSVARWHSRPTGRQTRSHCA